MERGFTSKSGAEGAGFVFLCLKSLEIVSLKLLMSSRDLVDGLLVWY